MAKMNQMAKKVPLFTHEGAVAVRLSALEELRRSMMACLLWEGTFYENGEDVAARIRRLTQAVAVDEAISLAKEARTSGNLRHVPLWMLVAMIENQYPNAEDRLKVGRAIPEIIQRADEMGELISLYWKDGKKPLTKQMKIGLGNALKKFNEYQLAKFDSDSRAIKVRDVMFLVHPKPDNEEQAALFKRIAAKEMATPDTWETQLSAGADTKETFTRLMEENKLGVLAFLRNLRNMEKAEVDKALVAEYAKRVNTERALPFRFIAAARAVPAWSDLVQEMMLRALSEHEKLAGKTAIVVDNSGSMYGTRISERSDLDRADAACALAVIIRELCKESVVIGYGTEAAVIASHYRGLALVEAIRNGPDGGTDTKKAIQLAKEKGYDRIIVITDEQSSTSIPKPDVDRSKAYFINVATYQRGIGYRDWTHIDGFSEATVRFIRENEASATV